MNKSFPLALYAILCCCACATGFLGGSAISEYRLHLTHMAPSLRSAMLGNTGAFDELEADYLRLKQLATKTGDAELGERILKTAYYLRAFNDQKTSIALLFETERTIRSQIEKIAAGYQKLKHSIAFTDPLAQQMAQQLCTEQVERSKQLLRHLDVMMQGGPGASDAANAFAREMTQLRMLVEAQAFNSQKLGLPALDSMASKNHIRDIYGDYDLASKAVDGLIQYGPALQLALSASAEIAEELERLNDAAEAQPGAATQPPAI